MMESKDLTGCQGDGSLNTLSSVAPAMSVPATDTAA